MQNGRTMRPAYRLYRWAWRSLDLVFPPSCGGCNQDGDRWCLNCRSSVKRTPQKMCIRCGEPMTARGTCETCRETPPPFVQLRSYAIYEGPIRNALQRLKFRRDISLGDALAEMLIDYFSQLDWPVDWVVPVPLSEQRKQERGYNQVDYIARPLSIATGLPYVTGALIREIDNPSQVGLSGSLRRQNVAEAFSADSKLVHGKRVLVVDDITTTGATMRACAEALHHAGALDVYGLTLAKAVLGKTTRKPQVSS